MKNGVEWIRADFPSQQPISLFSSTSVHDCWYVTNLENSTSVISHYHNGIVDNFIGPFGVSTYSMYVTKDNIPFFTSFSDVAYFRNGKFEKVEMAPSNAVIKKIVARNEKLFWILTDKHQLFVYEGSKYRQILEDRKVKDFQVSGDDFVYVLCDNELIRYKDPVVEVLSGSHEFSKVEKIAISPKADIWLVGSLSTILKFSNGQLIDFSPKEKFYLRDISISSDDEIWVSGNDGVLLYSGKRIFPPYQSGQPGFICFKLTNYSVNLDNEYGVAMADFNGDGFNDIFSVCIINVNRLFINTFIGKKEPVKGNFFSEEGSLRKSEGASGTKKDFNHSDLKLGVTVADIDNDGDEDVYICYLNSNNKLLLNNGNGVFRDVSGQPNRACEDLDRSTAAAFADVDLDGYADLYVTSENGSNRLYHNDGTGHFDDITISAGLATSHGGSCATFSDINGDGYPDLCATFWFGRNRIYLNESGKGDIKFREITTETDLIKTPPVKSNGATFADINNDGSPDLFIANRNDQNRIYLNNGHGNFRDVTDASLGHEVYLSNGGVFADFDMDGFQDLYLTNVGENILYKNVGGKYFKDVTSSYGAELSGYCTGSAVGDLNNDGNIDLYVANYLGGSSKTFINQSNSKNFVKFRLEGVHSNRDAIGAKIFLYRKNDGMGKTLAGYQEISGGGGYASISAKEANFPLVPGCSYEAIVRFPSAGSEVIIEDVRPGFQWVQEHTGTQVYMARVFQATLRAFKDPEIRRGFIQMVIVLLFLIFYFKKFISGENRIIWIRKSSVVAIFICFVMLTWVFIYSSSIVLFLLPSVIVVILLTIMHLITGRMLSSQELAKQRLKLREKISRDLHDDLASTLGSISIYSDTLKRIENPSYSEYKKLTFKIAELTHSSLQSITDIIWMTSPKNDSLQGLLAKTNNLLYETLVDNGIQYLAEINTPEHVILLPDELRNDLFLIIKESAHNIIKHSKANSVTFFANVNDHSCSITLMDDGIGFDEMNLARQVSHGNGLVNIRRRALESKVDLSIISKPAKGTIISLSFKI